MTGALILALTLRVIFRPLGDILLNQLRQRNVSIAFINFVCHFILALCSLFFLQYTDLRVFFSNIHFILFITIASILSSVGLGLLMKTSLNNHPTQSKTISSIKPLIGAIFGYIILHEHLNALPLVGITLVVIGGFFINKSNRLKFSFTSLKSKSIQYQILGAVLVVFSIIAIKQAILVSGILYVFIAYTIFSSILSYITMRLFEINVDAEKEKLDSSLVNKILLLVMILGILSLSTYYSIKYIEVGYALALFQLSLIMDNIINGNITSKKDFFVKSICALIMIAGCLLVLSQKINIFSI